MKIKDVCSRFSSGDFISADKIYSFGNYPVYGGNGLRGYTDNYNFDGECAIIGRQGAYSGNVKFFSGKGHMTEHAIVAIGNENNNTRFLAYKFGLMNLGRYAGQSAQPGLSVETLLNLDIDLPSKDNQDKIATVLSYLDNKIELNKKINATLEAMAKTLYDYWFVQFDFPDENGKPYKTSGGKMVYNAELGREIPAGWEVDSIGNHVSIKHGISYSSDDLMGKGIPMINLNSFNVDSSYKMEGIKNYSGNYTNSKCIHPYDLAICLTQQTSIDIEGKTNVIGKAIFIPDCFQGDIVSSMDVGIILCDNYYGKYYLHSLINTNFFHRYITGFSIGTKIKHLHLEGLLQYKCEKPPDNILKKFNSILINKLKKQSCIIRENQTLAALRDWLLPMLMNGQVRFKD